jgi:hypothetical protein
MPEWTKTYTIPDVGITQLAAEILSNTDLQLIGNGGVPDGAIRFTEPDQLVIAVYAGEPVQSVIDEIDTAVAAPDNLSVYKEHVNGLVDGETVRRILKGFVYPAASGKIFSLSSEAQLNWLGLELKAALLPYPYTIRTMDEHGAYAITSAADAQSMVNAAFVAKETALTLGRVVKTAVEGATTQAGVDAAAASWLAGGPP